MKQHGKQYSGLVGVALALTLAHGAEAMTLDQPTCEMTLAGTWTAGGTDICAVTDLDLKAGDALAVPAGVELNVDGIGFVRGDDPSSGLIAARLDVEAGGELVVVGDLTNEGVVDIDGSAVVTGTFGNDRLGIVELNGTLSNHGSLWNDARWFVMQTGELESDDTVNNQDHGTFSITGSVTLENGTMTNSHDVVNSGPAAILTIEENATFSNAGAGAELMNFIGGRIGNRGVIVNTLGARLTNHGGFLATTGKIINMADATVDNLNGGLIANVGIGSEIENRDGGNMTNSAMIHNVSVIENFCAAFFENTAAGVVNNPGLGMVGGRFDNFGGTVLNAGVFNRPPVQHACVFNP